jgi:uncharacterized membrane protein
MAGAKQRIVYSVEMDQGGDRWQAILHTEVFGHAQAIAEDARVGGAKVRVTEETVRDRPKRGFYALPGRAITAIFSPKAVSSIATRPICSKPFATAATEQ